MQFTMKVSTGLETSRCEGPEFLVGHVKVRISRRDSPGEAMETAGPGTQELEKNLTGLCLRTHHPV